MSHEPAVRLSMFLGVFGLVALAGIFAPRRKLPVSKVARWINNLGLVVLNAVLLRLLFPAAAVGMAAFAAEQRWGLFNYFDLPYLVVAVLCVVAMDFVIWLHHGMVHAIPALWRLHRVRHSVEDDETNSNFGFNRPWWDRLFGTCRNQPRGGHLGMTIGIREYRDPRQVDRLPGTLALPFRGRIIGYTINRRDWSGGTEQEPTDTPRGLVRQNPCRGCRQNPLSPSTSPGGRETLAESVTTFLTTEHPSVKTLIILNDPPYGTERSYNGLRLAKALSKKAADVTLFLMADAVACAKLVRRFPMASTMSN